MIRHRHCLKFGYSAAIVSAMGGSALAAGFDAPDQDAFAVARGQAVVATPDNPSAIFYNPAGLTELPGHNLRAGFYGLSQTSQFKNPTTGTTFNNQAQWNGLPQFFYSHGGQTQPVSFGLGVYEPSSLAVRWQDDTGFRTLGTQASLTQVAINPVVAFKLLDTLAFGVGLAANYAHLDLRQGLLWSNQPYDQFRFQGEGWGASGNAGLLWKPLAQLVFGASLQTGAKVNLSGQASAYNRVATTLPQPPYTYATFDSHSGAQANFKSPLKAKAGVAYHPSPDWNVEVDAEYIDWKTAGTVAVEPAATMPLPSLPVALQWRPSWYYELGATRAFDGGWRFSAGYMFNQNSVPATRANPATAEQDRHFFSVGVGRKCKRWDFDVAYQFGCGPDRNVSGSPTSAIAQSSNGLYGFTSHAIAASVGWRF